MHVLMYLVQLYVTEQKGFKSLAVVQDMCCDAGVQVRRVNFGRLMKGTFHSKFWICGREARLNRQRQHGLESFNARSEVTSSVGG